MCRMHGAAGGVPKGNRNAWKHGGATAEALAFRVQSAGSSLNGARDYSRDRLRNGLMARRTHNLASGLQLRAARALAGMSQADLAAALGVNERAVRFWEPKRDRKPDCSK